jgi:hypothetical protein
MKDLSFQRCFNHAGREAVARCPECGQFFCRECITEHDDRVVCAACLKLLTRKPLLQRFALTGLFRLAQGALGLLVAWFFFFLIGAALLRIPDSFHEGTLWQVPWMNKE